MPRTQSVSYRIVGLSINGVTARTSHDQKSVHSLRDSAVCLTFPNRSMTAEQLQTCKRS